MALDKGKLAEKLKSLSVEDRALFREALQEADPDGSLSVDELSEIREMLASTRKKKESKKGILNAIDSLFD